jgi:hypothetical protein
MPRAYRSATGYNFDEAQANAIIRNTTYHPDGYCKSVIWFSPREHIDISPSIATPFWRISKFGLGSLDQLPFELLFDTLYRVDLHSLFKFRQINRRSREIVDSLSQYQSVVSHGLNLFCVLLRTRLALDISLHDFYDALCIKECALCGGFGAFISLLVWKRCCFKCLRESPETQVRTLASIQNSIYIPEIELDQLRSFKSLPDSGTGTRNRTSQSMQNSRLTIVSLHQAILSCRLQMHTVAQSQLRAALTEVQLANLGQKEIEMNFMGSCALPYYDRQTGRVQRGIVCAGCQLAIEEDISNKRHSEWGLENQNKLYARDGFLNHFRWCEQAQLLWRSSGEGKKRPLELYMRTWRYGQKDTIEEDNDNHLGCL